MEIFKPLHLGFNHQVLEQNRQFQFVVSATMGIRLSTGEPLLEPEFMKDAIEGMGSKPFPDVGMPKPCGEYLVSGSYFSPGEEPVGGGEVKVTVGPQKKSLIVFGARNWEMGLPSKPEPITTMPIEYSLAYGGNGLDTNMEGMGYQDEQLPFVENPDQLITSPGVKIEPAGFSVLDPSCSQRMRFQGTYDENYLQQYFPGYPEDFDLRYFLAAPSDQWINDYYQGDESFEIHNMHPEKPVIRGQLPDYYARCFLQQSSAGASLRFSEISLNLDTLWFFPEKDLGLLIWRAAKEVADDEAEQVSNVLLAFEARKDASRSLQYYQQALEKRIKSDDVLLNNFNTEDLIPLGVKCAMQILQEDAQSRDSDSALAENLDAKIETVQALVQEKTDELVEQSKAGLDDLSGDQKQTIADLEKTLKNPATPAKDADITAFNAKLEAILPGITQGDPKKIELKNFSFDKIDKIMAEVQALTDKKSEQAREEAGKAVQELKSQAEKGVNDMSDPDGEGLAEIKKALNRMDSLNADETKPEAPLPRINADDIVEKLSEFKPDMNQAIQSLQAMKTAGIDNDQTRQLEKMIDGSLAGQQEEILEGLKQAESSFRQGYITGAHFMEQGLSPHQEPVENVAERFLLDLSRGKAIADKDWACIDLSGQQLDGIDLSNCLLEQVNFSGSSLRNVNFSGAILARANLSAADLTGANFTDANIGAVKALEADFTEAEFNNTKLSRADFSGANFTRCVFNDVESLELIVNQADFTESEMREFKFIEVDVRGASFVRTNLTQSVFLQSSLTDVNFESAVMPGCIWADVLLDQISFNKADLSKNCFAATAPEKSRLGNVSFVEACLDRSNFQNMCMPGSNLCNSSMDNAMFSGADLHESNLSKVNAPQAQFRKANLQFCDMTGINLKEGSLAKARISGARFTGANLYAVDFLRAFVGETDFSGCNLDNTLIQDWQPS